MAPLWITEGEKESTAERAEQPVTTADQKHVLLVRSFIHHCRPACIHVMEINEDTEWVGRVAGEREVFTSFPSFFSSAAHMVNEHAQCSYSDSSWSSWLLFPVCLLPLRSACACLTGRLSFCLFTALLYSFRSLSIALEANSQSQWAWVTRDKRNIAHNARKLHTYRCIYAMHVRRRKHTLKHSFILLITFI